MKLWWSCHRLYWIISDCIFESSNHWNSWHHKNGRESQWALIAQIKNEVREQLKELANIILEILSILHSNVNCKHVFKIKKKWILFIAFNWQSWESTVGNAKELSFFNVM